MVSCLWLSWQVHLSLLWCFRSLLCDLLPLGPDDKYCCLATFGSAITLQDVYKFIIIPLSLTTFANFFDKFQVNSENWKQGSWNLAKGPDEKYYRLVTLASTIELLDFCKVIIIIFTHQSFDEFLVNSRNWKQGSGNLAKQEVWVPVRLICLGKCFTTSQYFQSTKICSDVFLLLHVVFVWLSISQQSRAFL